MKKAISFILSLIMIITACPIAAFATGHTTRTEALVLGSDSMSNEDEGWSYDASTHTLVLSDVTIDCSGADQDGNCITATEDLNIVLEGENTLKSRTVLVNSASVTPTYVLAYAGDLNISGTGSLTILEGNYAIKKTSSNSKFVIDSGTVNIAHDFTNPEIDQSTDAIVIGNDNNNAVINGGRVYSDVMFFAKEINGGKINSYGIASKTDLTINDGVVNAGMLFAFDMVINGGTVTTTGGNIKTLAKDFASPDTSIGIVATATFEMNGGTVNACGSYVGMYVGLLDGSTCNFNGGSFTAEGGIFAILSSCGENSEPVSIDFSDSMSVKTPSPYKINTLVAENAITEVGGDGYVQYRNAKVLSVWDADVEEPTINYDQTLMKVESNAAKKVVIEEIETVSITFVDIASETTLDPITIEKGSAYTFPTESPIDPPTGKEFSGTYGYWNEADTEPTFVEAGQEYTVDRDIMVQPIWQKATPADITITYDANGGTTGEDWIESETVKGKDLPKEITVPKNAPENVITPPKYKIFNGFEVNGEHHGYMEVFTVTESCTVKYLWKGYKITVTYDANGGIKGESWRDSKKIAAGEDELPDILPENIIQPPDGMVLDAVEINGVRYQLGDTVVCTEDCTFKFIWKEAPKDKWYSKDGKTYYYRDGELLKGKQEVDGFWYIFSKADGSMMTGKVRCDNKWYIMRKATGEMLYGKVSCDGKWYITSKKTGEILYGKVSCDGITYIMSKADGQMLYGKVTCNGKPYICSKTDGHVFKNQNVTCDGIKYYCNAQGVATKR